MQKSRFLQFVSKMSRGELIIDDNQVKPATSSASGDWAGEYQQQYNAGPNWADEYARGEVGIWSEHEILFHLFYISLQFLNYTHPYSKNISYVFKRFYQNTCSPESCRVWGVGVSCSWFWFMKGMKGWVCFWHDLWYWLTHERNLNIQKLV